MPVGRISQAFEETVTAVDGSMIGGATNVHHTQAVPTLGFEAGLSWTPSPAWGWRRFTFLRSTLGLCVLPERCCW